MLPEQYGNHMPEATEKLNTSDKIVHPDVLARNTAPSGLKVELPPHLMDTRSPSLPPSRESQEGNSHEDLGSGFRISLLRTSGGNEVTWTLWCWCYACSAHQVEMAISQNSTS